MAVLFEQMTVCGVGLIGGSLADIARRRGLVKRVVGLGRSEANLQVALERGLIDRATRDPAEAAAGADLIVLAAPILALPGLLEQLAPALKPGAVVTDVGSVKGSVISALEPLLPPGVALVAAHPVAGKETTGAAAADPELFAGRRVIICPSARSTPEALSKVEQLWLATGALVERMDAALHDRILAAVSHLPQIVSSALGAALAEERVGERFIAVYGAGGLRDTTRLALSSPEMWRDICLGNRAAILTALELFEQRLTRLQKLIAAGDGAGLLQAFAAGREIGRHLAGPARRRPVIAIDGPVGAGKSTVAAALARELGFRYLSTGAMFRAVALAAQAAGLRDDEPELEAKLERLLAATEIAVDGNQVELNGIDVSARLAEPAVGDLASRLSTLAVVRERLRELQRALGQAGGVVMEGRDIGTAVFPDAEAKFYLDARVEVRAARRGAELRAKGERVSDAEVLAQLRERDQRDSSRALAPLRCADDAIVIDSTDLTVVEVVARLKNQLQRKIRSGNGA